MKMFKIAFLSLALAVASPIGFTTVNAAETVDLSGVPADKAAEIKKMIENAKPTTDKAIDTANKVADAAVKVTEKVGEAVSPEALSSYAQVGAAIGDSIAIAAQKVNLAVTDFSNTWVGKAAIFVILWKLLLGSIIGAIMKVILSIAWGSTVLYFWMKYFNKLYLHTAVFERTYKRKNPETNEMEDVTEVEHKFNEDRDVDGKRFFMFILLGILLAPAAILLGLAL